LQIYDAGNPPIRSFANGKSVLIGPDLRAAFRLLGSLAAAFSTSGQGGNQTQFVKVPNIPIEKP